MIVASKHFIRKKIATTTFRPDFSKYLRIVYKITFNVPLGGGGRGGVVSKSDKLCVVIPLPGKFMKGRAV